MTRRYPALRRGTGALIVLLTGLLACVESGPTDLPVLSADAKGGGAPVKVRDAVPSEAPQDTSLTVRVIGSGYDHGSVVKFLLAGQSTIKMVVHETRFVSSSELEADLTIAVDADVALYDIEVTTARGKKGIGTEKFSVTVKDPPWVDIHVAAAFRDATGEDGLLSDGGGAYDATILDIGNVFLDARKDVIPTRMLCLDFAGQPGAPDVNCRHGYFSTAQPSLEGGLTAMPVGTTIQTTAQATWTWDGYNWHLRFGMEDCDQGPPVDNQAIVTHPDDHTWTLEGTTACLLRSKIKGRPVVERVGFFDMPFKLTLVR